MRLGSVASPGMLAFATPRVPRWQAERAKERSMPLTVQSLGSGSSGNALLLDDGNGCVLVDCGIGPRNLAKALASANRQIEDITVVLVTHEHIDHVRGLKALTRSGARYVASAGTAAAAGLPPTSWEEIRLGTTLRADGMTVTALPVAHDAQEPCGYHIVADSGGKVVVLTDLGSRDEALHDPLSEANLVVLEANHDLHMLRTGPYPHHLKRRVLSATGHLSNTDCGEMLAVSLRRVGTPGEIWLAHLSQTNNRPQLAVSTVQQALATAGVATTVLALPRHAAGPTWCADRPNPGHTASIQMQIPGF